MKQIIADMTQYSDTELRVLLVISNTCEPLSMADLQRCTGRGRQVYTAVESLEQRNILWRTAGVRHGEKTWFFQSIYTGASEPVPAPVEIPPEPVPASVSEPVPEVSPPAPPVVEEKKVAAPRKRKSVEKPPLPPTAQHHPAVQAYVDITRRRPKQVVAEQIAKMVPEDASDVERWRQVVEQYVLNGWNPLNVANMIRMFKGELSWKGSTGRQRGATVIPHQPPDQARSDWAAYLLEEEY